MASGSSVGTEGCFLFSLRLPLVDVGAPQLSVVTSAVFDTISFTQVKVNASIFSSTSMIVWRRCPVGLFVLLRLVLTYCLKGKHCLFVIIVVEVALLLDVV